MLQDKVYKTCTTNLNDLKLHIRTEWAKLDHAVIAAAVHQWRRRLSQGDHSADTVTLPDNSLTVRSTLPLHSAC